MTIARRVYRGRRSRGTDGRMPEAVRAWFAGECSIPWEALLPPTHERVPEWWAAWCRANPGASPPADALDALPAGQFGE